MSDILAPPGPSERTGDSPEASVNAGVAAMARAQGAPRTRFWVIQVCRTHGPDACVGCRGAS